MTKDHGWMRAADAAKTLGVTRATLYAYVSRGYIRSEAKAGPTRERRYAREDVETLKRRHEERRDPEKAARRALQWGVPVLESSITLIASGRVYYRGFEASDLARTWSVADVASLIWMGHKGGLARVAGAATAASDNDARDAAGPGAREDADALPFIPRAQSLLAREWARDPAAFDRRPHAVAQTGWRIVNLLADTAAASRDGTGAGTKFARGGEKKTADTAVASYGGTGIDTRVARGGEKRKAGAALASRNGAGIDTKVARGRRTREADTAGGESRDGADAIDVRLARAWGKGRAGEAALVRAAIILCADHELNVSSFTARCVASAGSNPYDVVIAGLAAIEGTKHGGVSLRVEALLQRLRRTRDVRAALAERLRADEAIDGFGHPLYPDGDPRAAALMQMLREHQADAPEWRFAEDLARAAELLLDERPTIDFALAVLARVLKWPERSALTLFAIGRAIGWIGHAIEQYAQPGIIRPRAKYVGSPPIAS